MTAVEYKILAKRDEKVEQKKETDYTALWLERRERSKQDPDSDFLTLLAELSRGQQ